MIKLTHKNSILTIAALLILFITACPQGGNTPVVPKTSEQQTIDTEQQKIMDAEAAKVRLEVPNKANIIAGELKQEDISASGYDAASYAIKYEMIKGNSAERKADIIFFLKKEGVESKKRTVTITDFKAKAQNAEPTALELINKEADKVILTVTDKETITADELPAHKDKITASGYDTAAYTVNYTVIKPDTVKKEAEITFRLEQADLHSKTRTITITGFKEQAVPPETIDITETTLLALFDLTETKITASAAAKKIAAAQTTTVDGFAFEEAKAIAYDDKEGTFTVKVKGTKDGKAFDKTFTISGFAHPYRYATPTAMLTSGKKLVLDRAIEVNLSLDEFIEEANAKNGDGYVSFKIKVKVSDKFQEVIFGKHEGYALTARLEKDKNDVKKIKIYGCFDILAEKYENGVCSSESLGDYTLNNIGLPVVEDYFTEKDVFDHIAKKIKDDPEFVNASESTYPSAKYAVAMLANEGGSLFDDTKLADYKTLYSKDGGYLKIPNIGAFVDNVRGGGITADDYRGELTVKFYISKNEYISGGNTPDDKKKSVSHTVVRSGFKKLPTDIQSVLVFSLGKSEGGSQEKWKQRIVNTALISMKDTGIDNTYSNWFVTNDDLKENDTSGFYLILNGQNYTSQIPQYGDKFLVPINGNTAKILIKQLNISKDVNQEELTITVLFMGGTHSETIKITPKY